MVNKQWYASKTVWGGVLTFIGGGLQAVGLSEAGALLLGFGVALGFYGLRTATTKI